VKAVSYMADEATTMSPHGGEGRRDSLPG
jgi:hypothetical protein